MIALSQIHDPKEQIVNLIKTSSISSVDLLSEMVGIPQEQTLILIRSALEDGLIQGIISDDERRLYRTDLKSSSPPSSQRDIEFIQNTSPFGRFVIIAGFITFIAGQIMVRIAGLGTFLGEIGSSMVVGSLFIVALGLMLASRVTTEKRIIGAEISATHS